MNQSEINFEKFEDTNQTAIFARWMASSDPWKTLSLSEKYCLKAFEGPGKETWVLTVKGVPVGFVILQLSGTFKGYIQTLFVHPAFQGQGYGQEILKRCEVIIRALSPNIFICVSAFNESARRLYERFGFEYVGTLKDFIRVGYDELLYRKTAGPIAG